MGHQREEDARPRRPTVFLNEDPWVICFNPEHKACLSASCTRREIFPAVFRLPSRGARISYDTCRGANRQTPNRIARHRRDDHRSQGDTLRRRPHPILIEGRTPPSARSRRQARR